MEKFKTIRPSGDNTWALLQPLLKKVNKNKKNNNLTKFFMSPLLTITLYAETGMRLLIQKRSAYYTKDR
jgi:hypothetical protein